MDNTKKISVIIPVYNVEDYIGQCLESVILQTYKNIEIICVDDCSPDKSADIIKKYAENDSRIKYIKHSENRYQGGARNTGISIAEGYYITFVDSDDYIADKECYSNAISLLEKNNADISIFSFFEDYGSSKRKYKLSKSILGVHKLNSDNFAKVHCSPWNKIFKTSDIREKGLCFPEKIKFEDEAFWYKYVAAIEPVAVVSERSYYAYRIRENSTMGEKDKYIYDYLDVFIDIKDYLDKLGRGSYYGAQLLNLLYTPSISDRIYTLGINERKVIAEKFSECIKRTGVSEEDVNMRIGVRLYAYFIEDEAIRNLYLKNVEKLKKFKYKIIKPSLFIFKLKREIGRILNQLSGKR